MGSASEYQKRAAECAQRAQIVTRADDRARWMELAEDWIALSRVPFQRLPEGVGSPERHFAGPSFAASAVERGPPTARR
jgi:hypothetical protein